MRKHKAHSILCKGSAEWRKTRRIWSLVAVLLFLFGLTSFVSNSPSGEEILLFARSDNNETILAEEESPGGQSLPNVTKETVTEELSHTAPLEPSESTTILNRSRTTVDNLDPEAKGQVPQKSKTQNTLDPSSNEAEVSVLYTNTEESSNSTTIEATERQGFRSQRAKRPFGRRPFGPLAKYSTPLDRDLKWTGYFLEESLALVLRTSKNVMVDCTVIELRPEDEQIKALKTFGVLMEMVPLDLPEMVQLMTLCGQLPKNQIHDIQNESQPQNSGPSPQFSFIIFPGTKWCGMQDVAERYENLGAKYQLDMCCRAHDHCPFKVGSFENKYGVSNFGFGTRSHCLCDGQFYNCLKQLDTEDARTIGNVYFNILRVKCLSAPSEGEEAVRNIPHRDTSVSGYGQLRSLYECETRDEFNSCRFWTKQPIEYAFKTTDFSKNY